MSKEIKIHESLLIDYKNLQRGQLVFDSKLGEGKVEDKQYSTEYPILIKFGSKVATYTIDGKAYHSDKVPSLFLSSPYKEHTDEMVKKTTEPKKDKKTNNNSRAIAISLFFWVLMFIMIASSQKTFNTFNWNNASLLSFYFLSCSVFVIVITYIKEKPKE